MCHTSTPLLYLKTRFLWRSKSSISIREPSWKYLSTNLCLMGSIGDQTHTHTQNHTHTHTLSLPNKHKIIHAHTHTRTHAHTHTRIHDIQRSTYRERSPSKQHKSLSTAFTHVRTISHTRANTHKNKTQTYTFAGSVFGGCLKAKYGRLKTVLLSLQHAQLLIVRVSISACLQ